MAVLAVTGTFYFNAANAQSTVNGQADTVANNFIMNASQGGMKEVNTGKLAETKAQSSDLKSFAMRMVNDHTKANMQLMKIVKAEKYDFITPPASTTAPDPLLVSCSKSDFDKIYIKMMIMDHKQTIKLFQNAADNAVDQQIKEFAEATLPTLKMHLADIEKIAKQMGLQAN